MKSMILALVTIASASAMAAGKATTEYFFQPTAGAHAVQLNYLMDVRPGKISSNGAAETDNKQEISDLGLSYMYGLNENNAVGVGLLTGSVKYTRGTQSSTASGLGDVHATYMGFSGMWRYGADLGINTEKIKLDSSTSLPSNRTTGGMSLGAYVGLLMTSDALNYGGRVSYLMPFERQVDNTSGTKLTEGGSLKIAPFVEWNWGMGFLGAELAYTSVADTTSKSGNLSTTFKGENVTSLFVNSSYDFNEMFTGLLSVGMAMHPEVTDNTDKNKAYTETIATIGVRGNF
ncbi:MAG: hypothetical protein EOP06_11405 [Proteobacteria bacterium]|nr:MAG: hypothetical protein EOP06_11405 [Pseudomonadota bacterium]